MEEDQRFMGLALNEARKAMAVDEVPIGAILVQENRIISNGYNQVERLKDPTAHAEILAIRKASHILGTWRLTGTALYTTVEPCCMCIGAIILARISRLVYAVKEPKTGFCGSQADLLRTTFSKYGLIVESGILADEARSLMQSFFKKIRRGTEVWP